MYLIPSVITKGRSRWSVLTVGSCSFRIRQLHHCITFLLPFQWSLHSLALCALAQNRHLFMLYSQSFSSWPNSPQLPHVATLAMCNLINESTINCQQALSKAPEMSKNTATVDCLLFLFLVKKFLNACSEFVVDLCLQKPFWLSLILLFEYMYLLILVIINFSKTFASVLRRVIGLKSLTVFIFSLCGERRSSLYRAKAMWKNSKKNSKRPSQTKMISVKSFEYI